MKYFLGFLGLYMMVAGVLLFLKPTLGKRINELALKGNMRCLWAVVAAGFGILFIRGAGITQAPVFIYALGIISLLKAILLAVAPREKLIGIIKWWDSLPVGVQRLWGVMAFVIGVFVLRAL